MLPVWRHHSHMVLLRFTARSLLLCSQPLSWLELWRQLKPARATLKRRCFRAVCCQGVDAPLVLDLCAAPGSKVQGPWMASSQLQTNCVCQISPHMVTESVKQCAISDHLSHHAPAVRVSFHMHPYAVLAYVYDASRIWLWHQRLTPIPASYDWFGGWRSEKGNIFIIFIWLSVLFPSNWKSIKVSCCVVEIAVQQPLPGAETTLLSALLGESLGTDGWSRWNHCYHIPINVYWLYWKLHRLNI